MSPKHVGGFIKNMIVYVICAICWFNNKISLKFAEETISESFLQCLVANIHHCLLLHRSGL